MEVAEASNCRTQPSFNLLQAAKTGRKKVVFTMGANLVNCHAKRHTVAPFITYRSLCPSCNVHRMDQWGDHAVHCSSEVGVKFRHNLVHNILIDICSKVGIMVRKEAPMGFLSEDGKELRSCKLVLAPRTSRMGAIVNGQKLLRL
ncbi:hypothetical protein CTI12_AA050980 [Artemisia annua]|uniref:Uncharacterized protein n=1 Tax=Artemisia annua TaxID=35608 RepID=A0A2U1QBK8_ARTAN|nr:hypothetical protein CTI12_AA050980 [Artemisia annua]